MLLLLLMMMMMMMMMMMFEFRCLFFPKHHHGTMILKPYSRLLPGRGNMKKIICMTFHNDL